MGGNRRVAWKPGGPMTRPIVVGLSVLVLVLAAEAVAQQRGALNPQPLPPLADPADPNAPAKELFSRKSEPVHLAARAIGNYAGGCLAGAVALPISGETWQVMRLSRNRNWGHPTLIRFLERLADEVPESLVGQGCSSAISPSRA